MGLTLSHHYNQSNYSGNNYLIPFQGTGSTGGAGFTAAGISAFRTTDGITWSQDNFGTVIYGPLVGPFNMTGVGDPFIGFLGNPFYGSHTIDITDNGLFFIASNDRGYGLDTVGSTGAVYLYEFDGDNWNNTEMFTDPLNKVDYTGNVFFGTGTTGMNFCILSPDTNSVNMEATIYTKHPADWFLTNRFAFRANDSDGNFNNLYMPLTNDIFYTISSASTLNYRQAPAYALTQTFNMGVNLSYAVSYDQKYLYIGTGKIYYRPFAGINYTLIFSSAEVVGNTSLLGLSINGSRLMIANQVGSGSANKNYTVKYKDLVSVGKGGQSQESYISNGQDGTTGIGGMGVFNPNARTNEHYSTGGGQGGSSTDTVATTNTGGGGSGKENQVGIGGGSGYIIIREWNAGL